MFAHCSGLTLSPLNNQTGECAEAGREHNQPHDLNYWRGYYIPYVLLQSRKGRGVKEGSEPSFAWELSSSVCPWEVVITITSLVSFPFSSLNLQVFLLLLFLSSSLVHPQQGQVSSCVVLCCLLGLRPHMLATSYGKEFLNLVMKVTYLHLKLNLQEERISHVTEYTSLYLV